MASVVKLIAANRPVGVGIALIATMIAFPRRAPGEG
jgi:hypothetical protein